MRTETASELHDPYQLELHSKKQEELDKALCDIIEDTVQDCYDRDEILKDFRRTLEGDSDPAGNLPWPGACEIEETICRELHNTVTAALWSAARQTPYVCLEAAQRNDIDAASDVETWINIKAQQDGYDKALYDAIYLAGEGLYAPMFTGYDQKVIRSFELRDKPPTTEPSSVDVTPGITSPPERELVLKETPSTAKVMDRCPNPWDFYVWPISARGPQLEDGCSLCFERMDLTREDLTMGVLTLGYDRAAVNEMITRGPASIADRTMDDQDRVGLGDSSTRRTRDGGTWECFQAIGRAPLLCDDEGEPTIPEGLIHTDCSWMVCPALGIVFKQAYSDVPDGIRPYSIYHVITKPNSMYGEGIVSLTQPTSDEMTSITRFGINNMNLEASPMMSVAESWLTRYSKWTVAPGRFLPRQSSDPVGPKPVTWDVRSQALIMPWLLRLDNNAHRMAATESVNSALAGKVFKSAQVHFAEQMQQTKFDLFLANIQRGVKETFRIRMAIELQHMDDEGDTVNGQDRSVTVTKEQVEKRFRFLPQASSENISPAARLAKQQAISEIVNAYWAGVPTWMQLGCLQYMYALNHRLLVLAGERSPERYIGPDPQNQQPGMAVPGMPPMGMMGMTPVQGGNGAGQPNLLAGSAFDMGDGLRQASPFSPRNGSNGSNGNGAGQ